MTLALKSVARMKVYSAKTIVLSVLLLVILPVLVSADEVPDPCRLLSANDVTAVLGILGQAEIEPSPIAPPIASARLVDRGGGNIGVAMPVNSGPRKNTLVCGGRAGSIKLTIEVTSVPQAQVDKEEAQQQLTLLRKKRAVTIEQSTYGKTMCEEFLAPAAGMLGREVQPNNIVVTRMRCYLNRSGWQVAIGATPWTPQKDPPVKMDKLYALVELAAQHLSASPPSAAQNATTANTGVPAGFMSF